MSHPVYEYGIMYTYFYLFFFFFVRIRAFR